jgi:hypothetical protein
MSKVKEIMKITRLTLIYQLVQVFRRFLKISPKRELMEEDFSDSSNAPKSSRLMKKFTKPLSLITMSAFSRCLYVLVQLSKDI